MAFDPRASLWLLMALNLQWNLDRVEIQALDRWLGWHRPSLMYQNGILLAGQT
uniref:Uncharacterized protein n=1 Tax=Picea glauca TaxID=3330 RepID=A0A101M1C2_PICGL|nr:hypothetical protein ABT39_MTgene3744 [Picea glauca]QHR87497.1 hypothetical protein Q903MT_gene1508 [Picea sitchensis]